MQRYCYFHRNALTIICSFTSDPCFIVTVKPGKDALKFGLNGQYRLCLTPTGVVLEDIEKTTSKCYWPYNIIRQYGKSLIAKDFAIIVGRKNVLGEGCVTFTCSSKDDPDEIIRLLPIIKEKLRSAVKHWINKIEIKLANKTKPITEKHSTKKTQSKD